MILASDLSAPRWAVAATLVAGRLATNSSYRNSRGDIFCGEYCEGNGYFEVVDGNEAFTVRRVYSADDRDLLSDALSAAEARFPSKNSYHHCDACWPVSPCLALRAFIEDKQFADTIPIYVQPGCGDVARVFELLNEKLRFLRSLGVDAFIAWVDRRRPDFLEKDAAKST